jgi:hypothetical protein
MNYLKVVGLFLLLNFVACSNLGNPAVDAAKRAIETRLIDPGSAQYKNIKVKKVSYDIFVCGEVNVKNRKGGYSGFEPFLHRGGTLLIGKCTQSKYPKIWEYCH